jgi:antirestriction protein
MSNGPKWTYAPTHNPQIYVVCLASHNNGIEHGEWLDATDYDLEEQIQKLLETSPVEGAEEWAIHDYDDMPKLGANPDLETVREIAEMVGKHGEGFLAYTDYFLNGNKEMILADFGKYEDRYEGEFETEIKFAYFYAEQFMEIPKHLENYIDYEAIAENLFSSGYVLHNGHVFKND